jgi:predicted ribosomally synthesized peptide with nif11-like leader
VEVVMARQGIDRLREVLAHDLELRAKLEVAKSVDELIAVARGAGYEFTAEELREAARGQSTQELTDAELGRVAGGGNVYAIWLTTGFFEIKRQTTIVQDL